jgi:Mn-dependent DtxR family transcriptional regulator
VAAGRRNRGIECFPSVANFYRIRSDINPMLSRCKDWYHGVNRNRSTTESGEDYLVCILELMNTKGYARVANVAQSLSVAEPSASAMIKRLATMGYIEREKYRGFILTESGDALARSVEVRRRILSAFLRSLGLPKNVIRQDVHGLEHHLSQETLECLERLVKGKRSEPKRLAAAEYCYTATRPRRAA